MNCKCFFVLLVLTFQRSYGKKFGTRIVGGVSAYAGQYPYAAAINVQTANSRFFCAGTLISNQWVLTAGQCVDRAVLFTIQLGSNTLKGEDPNRVTLPSFKYFLHPEYNPSTLENDIGLIKLRDPVEYNLYLNKVDFLGANIVAAGSRLIAIGWGQTSDDDAEFSNDLQWVSVVALSNEQCRLTYGNQINNQTICIEGNYNEGSCFGDTGSPLLQDIGRGYMMHAGIASFISANGCESTDPSGYIRTFDYRDWIRNVTEV